MDVQLISMCRLDTINDSLYACEQSFYSIICSSGAVDLVARSSQTCAVLVNAKVYCWGNSDSGQLRFRDKDSFSPKATEVMGLEEGELSGYTRLCYHCV